MINASLFPPPISPIPFNNGVPVGTVVTFAGEISNNGVPDQYKTSIESLGWLVCDGRELKIAEYPVLFSTLGYLYGGTRNETFRVPDLRGMFLRGIGTDDASNELRTPAPGGSANGIGSTQGFALQEHVHVYNAPVTGTLPPGPSGTAPVDNAVNSKEITAPPTENTAPGNVIVSKQETRPINTYIYYIIKYM